MGHAGFDIFIYIYNEKTSFHDDVLKRCILMFFSKACCFVKWAPRVPMLRGFRRGHGRGGVPARPGSEGSEGGEGRGGHGGEGASREGGGGWACPARFFLEGGTNRRAMGELCAVRREVLVAFDSTVKRAHANINQLNSHT
jgi:hypothetical protein